VKECESGHDPYPALCGSSALDRHRSALAPFDQGITLRIGVSMGERFEARHGCRAMIELAAKKTRVRAIPSINISILSTLLLGRRDIHSYNRRNERYEDKYTHSEKRRGLPTKGYQTVADGRSGTDTDSQ